MGTRGALGFVVDETAKITYNHFDSYPSGLGDDTLRWLRGVVADPAREQAAADAARRLREVTGEPTDEEARRYSQAGLADTDVSTGADWYALLRRAQGDPAAILDVGIFESAAEFPRDSLFCEWAYLVDFDARVFEVYEGFRQAPPTAGRWAGESTGTPSYSGGDYYPIERVAAFPFDELPEKLDEDELTGRSG